MQLRGQADYLHKLVAASHIYDTWTAKGSDAAALADRSADLEPLVCSIRKTDVLLAYRFLDGSIDMLDRFMAVPNSIATQSNDKGSTIAQTVYPAQNPGKSSLLQQTLHELHAADILVLPVVEQSNDIQSQDNLHPDAASVQQRSSKVTVVQTDNLSYQQFVQNFMQPNLPVMIQVKHCHRFDIHGCLHAKPCSLASLQPHSRFLVCVQSCSPILTYSSLISMINR